MNNILFACNPINSKKSTNKIIKTMFIKFYSINNMKTGNHDPNIFVQIFTL